MSTKRGFTLGELVVLIGLVALIAGMILPALTRGHGCGGRDLKCKNNLRQLGTGMIQYIDQYGKGRYYTWPGTQKASFNGAQWIASMYWTSLLNEPDLYICPSSVDDNGDGGRLGRRFTTLRDIDVSYAGRDGRLGALPEKMPSNTIMMCDDSEGEPNHEDGVNLLYFDAHVEWRPDASPLSNGKSGRAAIGQDAPLDMLAN